MIKQGFLAISLCILLTACAIDKTAKPISQLVPTLNELSGKWVSTDTIDMKHRNFKINKHLGHSHRFIHRF